MYVDPIRQWVLDNDWMWIIGLVGGICVLCALMGARNQWPLNIILLILWTALMAYTVAMVCHDLYIALTKYKIDLPFQ